MTAPTEPVEAALALVTLHETRRIDGGNVAKRLEKHMTPNEIGNLQYNIAAARILAAEVRSIRAILSDANAVHLNMLRGTIAWTPENLRHVTGDDTVIAELLDEVRRLRSELASQPMIATETHVLPPRK